MRCDGSDGCDVGWLVISYIFFIFFKQTTGKVYHSYHTYHDATYRSIMPCGICSLMEV